MKGVIRLRGRDIVYTLTRRQVKNINIRVRSDGSVGVSAAPWVPVETVEEILRSRETFLLGAMDRFAAQAPKEEPAYADGETVSFLGRPHTLRVSQGKPMGGALEGDTIRLTVPDPENREQRERAYRGFQKEACLSVTANLCRECQPAMAHLGVPVPEVRVRAMTSRWGSCKPSDKRVTFASQLIEAPMECVAYVVWHELTHFVHPNHSKAFYGCLGEFCPDWKALRRTLNEKSYRLSEKGDTNGQP